MTSTYLTIITRKLILVPYWLQRSNNISVIWEFYYFTTVTDPLLVFVLPIGWITHSQGRASTSGCKQPGGEVGTKAAEESTVVVGIEGGRRC